MSKDIIKEIIFQFNNLTLPKSKWTHEAHLIVAIWFLKHYEKAEATYYLRSGIINYNLKTGTKNTPTSGYHETITIFWIELIDWFIKQHKNSEIEALIFIFLKSKYASKTIFLEYYSKELLFSTIARANWIAPDLKGFTFA